MTALAWHLERASQVLHQRFGYPAFRMGQFRAVRAALAGRSALVVLPTGGGKSLCFQVPALVLDGLTVVVSPLISLMQDQVQAACARGIRAAFLTSSQGVAERQQVLRDLEGGAVRMLYVAPERLAHGGLIGILRRLRLGLLAVDEAHCVSEWGHDFRPAYRRIGLVRQVLGRPPTLALTATATPAVRDDIVDSLRLGAVERIVGSFDRPNLTFAVRRVRDDDERRRIALALLKPYRGAAVLYVPTRSAAERWTRVLWHAGVRAAPYHAGLEHGVRRMVLQQFLADHVDCVVATSAFGMGIDKPNVRTVLHFGLSTSLESYYQEAGRAGRDGKRGLALMLWTRGDLAVQRRIVADGAKLEPLLRYVSTFGCRRRLLLDHFGERMRHCAGCDRCLRSAGRAPAEAA